MTTISLVVYKNCNYVFYFIIKHYTVKLYNEAVYFHSTQIWIWKRQQFINLYSLLNIQVNQPARFSLHFHSVNSVLIKYKYEVFWVYICYVTHFYSYVLFTMRESHCNNYVLMAKDLFTFWPSAGFPGATVVKNPPAHAGDARDTGSIHGLGRSAREGNGNSLQCSCLENPMDRGAWWATIHVVTKSQTQLCNWLPPANILT